MIPPTTIAAACVLAVFVGGAGAAAGAAPPAPYRNPTVGSEVALQIPGMHLASVRRGLVYRRVDGISLRLDVHRPRASGSRRLPVVLLGGPYSVRAGRTSGQKVGWAQLIAASGMAAVAFDTRSDNALGTPYAPARDVAGAIAYVRRNGARLGLDGARLCTLGFSLGTAPWHLWAAMRHAPPYVRCNAVYYGPLDLRGGSFGIDPGLAAEFSAITYLQESGGRIAPMLIAKAGRDQFSAINTSIDAFARAARELGAPVRVLVHPTGQHAFDVGDRGARSRTIIRETLTFFRNRLRQP